MWTLGCSHHTGSVSVTDNKNLSVKVRKNVQLVFQHCCKMSLMATLRFLLVTLKPILQQFRLLQVSKICCRKQRVVPFFATKSLFVARFTGLKQTRFAASLHNRRFMSQARRTRHFACSARRGEEKKNKALFFSPLFVSRCAQNAAFTSLGSNGAPVMQAILQQVP